MVGAWDTRDQSTTGARGQAATPPAAHARAALDNPRHPHRWNRYAYVDNTPLEYTDPTGLKVPAPCSGDNDGLITCTAIACTWSNLWCGSYSDIGPSWGPSGDMLPYQQPWVNESGGSGGGGGGGGNPTSNPTSPPPAQQGLFACASAFADKYSIAGGLQALGIGNSGGIGSFLVNALGGNTFSGIVGGFANGESAADMAFAGAYQGLGGATPETKGLSGLATDAAARGFWSTVTGAGQTITTLSGETSLASTALTAAKFADIVGWAKLGYDGLSFAVGLASCAGN